MDKMKGFIFTIDAIFALVIAAVGVSILLYVDFTAPGSYTASQSQAYSIMQSMLQTSIGVSSQGSAYIGGIATYPNSSVPTWPQYGHDAQLSSDAGYAPTVPYLLYTYNTPTNMLPAIVIDGGFAAIGAGNIVYIINATNGKTYNAFPASPKANVVGVPALYRNMLFYANASNVVKGISIYGPGFQWNFTAGNTITTPLEIENNYLAFGTTNSFYLLNMLNGTSFASVNLPGPSEAPLYVNGEYIVSTASNGRQNYIFSYALVGNQLVSTWNGALTSSVTTSPSTLGNTIAVGSGNYVYIFTLGGNQIAVSPDLGSGVVGISSYGSQYFAQAAQKIYSISTAGNTVSFAGTAKTAQNATPSSGSSTLYALVSGNLFQGYSTSLKMLWNISLPSNYLNTGYAGVALAYGNIYVPNGNTLYVFGTYKPQLNDNILQTLAGMYLNNQGGYANLALDSLYNSSTTGIFINSTYAPDYSVAGFNAISNSYIEQTGGFAWMNNALNQFTISVWVNPLTQNGVIVDELGQRAPNSGTHDSFLSLSNGIVYMSVGGQPCTSLGAIPTNSWTDIVMTYNGNNYRGYINGVASGSGSGTRTVPGGGRLMYYPLGVGDSTNCGSASYFTGNMLDYQFYNISIGSTQIAHMWQNGAFGAPIGPLKNLEFWMPLDGNSDDYSGMLNHGLQYSVAFRPVYYIPSRLANSYQVSRAAVPLSINVNGTIKTYNVSVVTWR